MHLILRLYRKGQREYSLHTQTNPGVKTKFFMTGKVWVSNYFITKAVTDKAKQ